MKTIQLTELKNRDDAITPAIGGAMEEAALVCLESQSHRAGVILELHPRDLNPPVTLFWETANPNAVKGWRDSINATNWGACGVAALVTYSLDDLKCEHQSRTWEQARRDPDPAYKEEGGFDYFLVPRNSSASLMQDVAVRLEVSGIRSGGMKEIDNRIEEKRSRYESYHHVSADQLMILVVEFSKPQAHRLTR